MRYNPPRFCDMCFIAYIENLCFKNCERPDLDQIPTFDADRVRGLPLHQHHDKNDNEEK